MSAIFDTDFALAEYIQGELGEMESQGWFAYDGYSPSETLKLLREIEPNHETLMNDVKVCAYFVMNRGNKPSKAMQKMHNDGRKKLSGLITKYRIMQTSPKSKTDVTMLRVAGIVPLFCAQVSAMPETRTVGARPESLPKSLAFSSAPALIPRNRQDLYNLWLEWALNFNQIIAGGKSSDKVDFFGRIIQEASYLTDSQRITALATLGIM